MSHQQETRLPYREAISEQLPRFYNGYLHFFVPNLVCIAGIALSISQISSVQWWEWLMLPAAFLFANIGEWWVHQGPLHNKVEGLRLLFDRHTLTHHEYFHHDSMAAESHKDWFYVLFPMWAVFGVFLPMLPIVAVLFFFVSVNAAWIFMLMGFFYFIFYEWMHLLYHLPENHWATRNRLVRFLQRHHRYHHHKRLMQKYNFNVTFPLGDYLFGTVYHPEDPARPAKPAAPSDTRGQ